MSKQNLLNLHIESTDSGKSLEVDFSTPSGIKIARKSIFDATRAPSATDDLSQGFETGSRWIDVSSQKTYECISNASTAAIWVETSGGGSGGASALNDLSDVSISSVQNGQILQYNSATSQWENVNNTGGGAAALNDLTDVTISAPSTDQVLKYNGSTWVNSTAPAASSALYDLSDVVLTSATDGQVLTKSGSNWINADLPAVDSALSQLTDVSLSTLSSDEYLKYNGTAWINSALPSIPSAIDDLSDVTISTPSSNQYLKYNGSAWVNSALPAIPAALDDLSDVAISSPATDQILKYNGSAWINAVAPAAGASALNDLSDVTLATPADGEVLTYESASSQWKNKPATGGSSGGAATASKPISWAFMKLAANQTTGLAANGNIAFDTITSSSDVVKTANGRVKLPGGKTYILEGGGNVTFTAASAQLSYQWYDVTNAAYVGDNTFNAPVTRATNFSTQQTARAIVSPTADTEYELRVSVATSVSLIDAGYFSAFIFSVSEARPTLTGDHAFVMIKSAHQTTGLNIGDSVRFNSIQSSSGTDITYSTSTYRFSLKAGRTYELEGSLRITVAANATYQWYNHTTAAFVGAYANIDGNEGTTNNSSNYPAKAVITADVDTEVSLCRLGGTAPTQVLMNASYAIVKPIEKSPGNTVYTTGEAETGEKWTNGRKIYRQLFSISLAGTGAITVAHNIANFVRAVKWQAFWIDSSSNSVPLPWQSSTGNRIYAYIGTTNIVIERSTAYENRASETIEIMVEYYKTS